MSWAINHDKGTLLRLYIRPGANKSEISGLHGDRLKVKVKAPPQDGEANEALIEFVAEVFEVSKSKVHFIRGETSRQKDLLVELPLERVQFLYSKM